MISMKLNYRKLCLIFLIPFLLSLILFNLFKINIYSKANSTHSSKYHFEYDVKGKNLIIRNNTYEIKYDFTAKYYMDMNFTEKFLIIDSLINRQIFIWNYFEKKRLIINLNTGLDFEGNYPIWYINGFYDKILVSTNFSVNPLIFIKSHQESQYLNSISNPILCWVYVYRIDYLTESLIILLYYDENSKLLIKYLAIFYRNLISQTILECNLVSTNYTKFSFVDPVYSLYLNNYVYIIAISISIIISLIIGKAIYSYKNKVG